jgi:hypothetical protein
MRHRPQAGSPDRAHHPGRVSEAGPPPSSHRPEAKLGERDRIGLEHHRKADSAMADDKAKIDWKMLETADAEPAQEEVFVVAPSPAPSPAPAPIPAPLPASPSSPAGKIVFHCSNGHRIVVAATMGGQRGKCSKCGVAVRIPASSESPASPARAAEARVGGTGAEAAVESPAIEEAVHPSGTADRFGGVTSQQAPDHDDSQAVGQSATRDDTRDDMFSSLVTASDSHVSATEFVGFSTPALQAGEPEPEPGPGGPEGGSNPTARLMDRLFREMEHGGIVEVHITGGSVILPEFYEPRWSVGSHGLFASRAADGTVTLTAVAWDSIQKIIVRQVNGLPDGMFE